MSITGFLKKLTTANPTQFVAPIINQRRVVVVQDGVPFFFDIDVQEPGWYLFSPKDDVATADRKAMPWEREEYLNDLVEIRVLALYRAGQWMAMPFNMSDARQKGWHGNPLPMNLVNGSIEALSVHLAYMFGDSLLHGRVVGPVMQPSKEEQLARRLIANHALEIERRAEREKLEQLKKTVGGQIEYQLAIAGADLVDWAEFGNGYRVTWQIEVDGRTVRKISHIGPNMMCDSVGRCVDGTDQQHSLASGVEIVRYGERW